ncbi:abortive infection bacteriophage resistance protein [Kribbella steppae]|uniref:Abortive infection bacteriophage resistance protein n=1 Tax=Kribbella steppae TaxID=2512223 RepID=A0A4R2HE21_9ACTN|nr:Abi family protein [Kribbella steppae]TCO24550.1 abortive infection bacteriophage resistance protein [Kribbella steppae]
MTRYTKPHLSFADQVSLLKSRGLIIDDEAEAEHLLSVIGYYRLSGYWYSYRRQLGGAQRDDLFAEGASFRQVVRLYNADRRLKLAVLDAIGRIEIAVRVQIGFTLGRRGPYAHLSPGNLDGQFTRSRSPQPSTYDRWLGTVLAAQTRSSEDFVLHFQRKYDGRLPVWVVTEILDFGSMSYLFQGLKAADRNVIARRLGVLAHQGGGNGAALANWLRVLNYVRNICAHHSRLWNRNLANQIAPSHLGAIPDLRHLRSGGVSHFRIYSTLCILAFLLTRIGHGPGWARNIRHFVGEEIPACGRDLDELGFPADWTAHRPWTA